MKFSIKNKLISQAAQSIGSYFVSGLITLLPIMITFWLFTFLFQVIKALLAPLKTIPFPFLQQLPHYEVIVGIIMIFIAGIFLRSFVITSFMDLVELLFHQVPLVRPVYAGIKQLVHAFSPSDKESFQRVVLIEYPRTGIYSLGFQTHKVPPILSPNTSHIFYTIFIPITPNPTHGFFVIAQEKDIHPLDISNEEAMTIIISGGIVQPKRFETKQ